MGVCNSAKFLAQAVIDSGAVIDSRQQLQLEILKLGPLYLGISNLPLWETAFQSTLVDVDVDDESIVGIMINEVYELAMLNMYGAFDAPRTMETATMVVDTFNQNGVTVSTEQLELNGW